MCTRMTRFLTAEGIARQTYRSTNSVKYLAAQGYFTAYQGTDGKFYFDLDEVEAEIVRNPRIRNKKNPFGDSAKIAPLPPTAQIVKTPRRVEAVRPDEVRQ